MRRSTWNNRPIKLRNNLTQNINLRNLLKDEPKEPAPSPI